MGMPIGLAVFDTFAKLIAAAGGDENQAKDQGMVFANMQRVKNDTRACTSPWSATPARTRAAAPEDPTRSLGDVDVMVRSAATRSKPRPSPKRMTRQKVRCFRSSRRCTSSAPTRMATRSRSTL